MSNPSEYTIGWICAIRVEYVAARCFLDEEYPPIVVASHDNNTYTLGRIGAHKVVIVAFSNGLHDNGSPVAVARDLQHSFPNIRACLMVGIAGGAPSATHDIRLGDVVVSTPRDNHGGVLRYDFGRAIQDGAFMVTGFLPPPSATLHSATRAARAEFEMMGNGIEKAVATVLSRFPRLKLEMGRPGPETDILYRSHVVFDPSKSTTDVGLGVVVSRPNRSEENGNPEVHYGTIASSNRVMKSAAVRDTLAADRDVLCFEMEAAGLMNHNPCLVVRGICDYSDSHEYKGWQGYAALTAAAYAKAIICRIQKTWIEKDIEQERLSYTAMITNRQGISSARARGYYPQDIIDELCAVEGAEYDASGIHPDRICHPETRVELLQEIQTWAESSTGPPVYWLYGMGGHGKSTIARTVAKRFDDKQMLGATFFFKREHYDRSSASSLFSTIAQQLARRRRDLVQHIVRAVEETIDISFKPIEEQFGKLIVGPFQKAHARSSKSPRVLVVLDALDECSVEEEIKVVVTLLRSLLKHKETGIKVFVTSRPETTLLCGIHALMGSREELQLRNLSSSSSWQNIGIVLQEKLERAKDAWSRTIRPPLDSSNADYIPPEWPSTLDVERLKTTTTARFDTSDMMSESDMYSRTTVVERNFSDAASVYSVSSAGSSIGIPHGTLQSCISYIGDNILDAIGHTAWFHTAMKYHPAGKIQQRLRALLRDFSASLEHEIPSQNDRLQRAATRIIRRCRQKITSHICNRADIWLEHVESLDHVNFERLPLYGGDQLSIDEIMGLFNKDSAEHGPKNDDQGDTDDEGSQPDEHDDTVDLHPLQSLLFGGTAFAKLCSAIKEALYDSDPPHMRHIENLIRGSLASLPPKACENCPSVESSTTQDSTGSLCVDHTYPYSVTVQTDWNPLEFLHAEFEKEVPSLGVVITYTGLATEAFATTCSQYLSEFWPSNSTALLDALDLLLLDRRMSKTDHLETSTASPALNPEHALKAKLSDNGEVSIEAYGTIEFLIQIAQQITWITSAMRSFSDSKNVRLGYSPIAEEDDTAEEEENASRPRYYFATLSPTPVVDIDGSPGGDRLFALTCRSQEIPDTERSCWFNLVSNGATIAANFPTPARHDEKGLEIPMGILVKIAAIRDAIEYKGGIVMKGPTLMLVPIKRNPDLNIIQWHVVSASKKRKRLSYLEGVEKCKQRALIDEVDLHSFLGSRVIVGWWDHAESRLGNEDVNFDKLTWSSAKPYEPVRILTIAAGLQQIGVLNVECAPGRRDSGYLVKFEGPYKDMLLTARGEKAFLYDTVQERAWLVTWDEVILHVIRKRNSDGRLVCDGAHVKIPTTGSAMQSLLVNRKLVLVDDEDEPETLRLAATRIFNQLETLAVMDNDRSQAPEKAINVPDVLIGHEFMSIVNRTIGRDTKKNEIRTTSGGWARLVEDSASLVLFANGFDDLICPTVNAERLCSRWKTVPWGKDYLAATTDTLLRLYFRGNEMSQEYLTSSGLCWHKDHSVKLFEKCPEPSSKDCGCSRLQQIVPKPTSIGAVDRPRTVSAGGAVIFGVENVMAKFTLPTMLRTKKDTVMYSQPNLQFEGRPACENGALGVFKQDNGVSPRILEKFPRSIESGSTITAQKAGRLCSGDSAPISEVWAKRSGVNGDILDGREDGLGGKRQKY